MWLYLTLACATKQVSPQLEKKIGTDFAANLSSSEYSLFIWENAPSQKLELKPAEQKAIRTFLNSPEHYSFSANVRCRLRPNRVLVFQNEKTTYQVLLSHNGNCPKLRFVSEDKVEIISLKPEAHTRFQTYIH